MIAQDPEVRAIGEANWARFRKSLPPPSPIDEVQEVFATKGHVLESTQIFSDWVSIFCRRCEVVWSAHVHCINVGFFRGLNERKGAP